MEIGTCTTTLSLTEKINCTATRGFGGSLARIVVHGRCRLRVVGVVRGGSNMPAYRTPN